MIIKKAKNEKKLIAEQNAIKKYLNCLAVYDIPKGTEASIFTTKYDPEINKREYKLYIFKNKQDA